MILRIHRPTTHRPTGINQVGYFLAGILDGDVDFSNIPGMSISFYEKDITVAHYLKKQIGWGTVKQVKKKKAVTLSVSHPQGVKKIAFLVHNKLKHPDKIVQYNTRLCNLHTLGVTRDVSSRLGVNHWFCGFFLIHGSFQIKILHGEDPNKPGVRLVAQISQKNPTLLHAIKNQFGGDLGYRSANDTYYWSSASFAGAEKVAHYFDTFHLMGCKLLQYVIWRKVFLKIQERSHLTAEGIKWIIRQKEKMSEIADSTAPGSLLADALGPLGAQGQGNGNLGFLEGSLWGEGDMNATHGGGSEGSRRPKKE